MDTMLPDPPLAPRLVVGAAIVDDLLCDDYVLLTLMISPEARNAIQIDRVCSAAICEEIGARLRIRLAGEQDRLPQHLITLMDAIRTND